jgi:3-deoxy-manno-octulosonate cytidylyltransferase (CMP-KDO synthetase)
MKINAIIPSRFGSSRFEGKPLALIAGQPMIQHVYARIRSSKCVDQVYVATDEQRIATAVQDFGGKAIMTSDTLRSGTDRVAEAAEKLGMAPNDVVINVQGDQPLIHPGCLDQVVQPLLDNPDLSMSTLAIAINNLNEYTNPKDCKVVLDVKGRALYFSRAAIPVARDPETQLICYKHLGIYAYRVSFLEIFRRLPTGRLEQIEKLEQLRALEFGHTIQVALTTFDSPEVDLLEDIPRIESMLQNRTDLST